MGTGGVFDVQADGALVFSKFVESRFPEEQEVVDALAARARDGA